MFYVNYVEPAGSPPSPQKAPFVLRTIEEQMEMIRGSEPRSLFIRLIQRGPFYQKGTKNIVLNQSSLH